MHAGGLKTPARCMPWSRRGQTVWGYLVVPRVPRTAGDLLLEIFFAEHVQVAERQRAIADPGQERGELPGLGPAGVLHALLVGGEFHHEQVAVLGVPVSSEHGPVRYPVTFGSGHPL